MNCFLTNAYQILLFIIGNFHPKINEKDLIINDIRRVIFYMFEVNHASRIIAIVMNKYNLMRFFIFLLISSYSSCLLAQSEFKLLSGQVISQNNSEPLAYATVHIGLGQQGVISDSLGQFKISISNKYLNDSLTVSHLGYYNVKLKISDLPDTILVTLNEDIKQLKMLTVSTSNELDWSVIRKAIKKTRKINSSLFYIISIDSALQKAAVENKYVILYFSAKWCGPCNVMEYEVFTDSSVVKKLNNSFVPLKIDADVLASQKIMSEFNIAGFPSFIVIDNNRLVAKRKLGRMDKDEFMNFLTEKMSKTAIELTKYEKETILWKKELRDSFRPDIGIELGASSIFKNPGFNSRIYVAMENKRYLIRPGLGYTIVKNNTSEAKYLNLPVDLGFTFNKTVLFGLSGGFRSIISPYFGFRISNNQEISDTDYGLKYGLESYIGDNSKIAIAFSYNHGLKNIFPDGSERHNRGFFISALLTL